MHSPDFLTRRKEVMVYQHLYKRGITDERILNAFRQIPREEFVAEGDKYLAYEDRSLSIGFGQTISQPYIVGLMCQTLTLKPNDIVLDIGTGSGYQSAILGLLVREVITIERIKELADLAEANLSKLQFKNIKIIIKDGSQGYLPKSPYDAIKSAAASSVVPQAWKEQLKDGGVMVLPLRFGFNQYLYKITKNNGFFRRKNLCPVTFVPLIDE